MDGVNLLILGLDEVRGRIAAIPQDPVLFSGSVRSNLDPFDRYDDAQLWEALRLVNLHVRNLYPRLRKLVLPYPMLQQTSTCTCAPQTLCHIFKGELPYPIWSIIYKFLGLAVRSHHARSYRNRGDLRPGNLSWAER